MVPRAQAGFCSRRGELVSDLGKVFLQSFLPRPHLASRKLLVLLTVHHGIGRASGRSGQLRRGDGDDLDRAIRGVFLLQNLPGKLKPGARTGVGDV